MCLRFLISLFLVIILAGCTALTTEETDQDPSLIPESIRITPDVVYGHKFGMALTFDMYQPKNQNGAGVIWINSGAWISGHFNFYKETADGLRLIEVSELLKRLPGWESIYIKPLLDKGFTVFDLRHGSSPKFDMDEIVADLRRAVRFIRHHSGDWGIDSEKLGLWGASAGGHLSLLLGTTADIGNAEATDSFEKGMGRVAAVVAYCPPTHLVRPIISEKNGNTPSDPPPPVLMNMTDDQLEEYSPINFASSDDPPTLIIHGDKDPLVSISEGESMHQALLNHGVESKLVTIPDAGHGFEGEDADHALAEAVGWFEEHLVD